MKNLKRVLALVLVVTLVFSLSVSALAFTDDAAITHNQAVNVLSELGVIKGYPDGSFRPNDPVTRAEMAKMITVILNKGVDDPTQFESGTTDLTDVSWNWASSYITYCYLLNIIAGYGDGTFKPDNDVTVQEAAKMILVSLGFDVTQEGLEGINWAVNANSLANQFDLYTGVTQSVNEAATRDTIAQMLYNMLKSDTVKYDVNIYTGISTLNRQDETAIEKYFDCEILNGIIVANEYAALWGGVPLMEGRTEVLFYDKDATANGMFDIADANYVNGVFNNYISDILKISTGKDELGMWVSLIRNRTTKNVIGEVMMENNMMTVVEGGDGNFVDAIKAAGLRLSDGRYSLFVNGEIFKWESSNGYANLPEDLNHPLNSNTYSKYNASGSVVTTYDVFNAYLGTILESVFGSEYKDMNGMTFRAIELNGDNYVDAIFVEAETLTQVTKVETKAGAKHYTFAGLNMDFTGTTGAGSTTSETDNIDNYTAQSVNESYIETDDTIVVDDYVLVTQVNETYFVSKVVFDDLTISAKSATAKTLTLKDSDGSTNTYKTSDIPVAYAVASDQDIHTKNPVGGKGLVDNTVTGNKYTFGFDSAGNVVMAKAVTEKTKYAMMNGMATTYGSSYTAQLFLEDGSTITGGVDDFSAFDTINIAASTPAAYIANATYSASTTPRLVSYKEDGSDLDLYYEADNFAYSGNTFTGGTTLTIDGGGTGNVYRVTSDTVFFYRIQGIDNKVNYYTYTDYTKAPTFTSSSVDVYVAENADNAGRADAVLVIADKEYDVIDDAPSADYIYISKVTSTDYTNKQSIVSGILIDKNFKVTEVTGMVFDKAMEDATTAKTLYTYTTTGTEDVYKLGPSESLRTLSTRNDTYIEWGSGSSQFATYSSSLTNTYRYTGQGGDRYEKLTGNFGKNLGYGEQVYVVTNDSNVAVFIMKVGSYASYTSVDATETTTTDSYALFYKAGSSVYTVNYAAAGNVSSLDASTQDEYDSANAYYAFDSVLTSLLPAADGNIALLKLTATTTHTYTYNWDSATSAYVKDAGSGILATTYAAVADSAASSVSGSVALGTGIIATGSPSTGEYEISAGVVKDENDTYTPSGTPAGIALSGAGATPIPNMTASSIDTTGTSDIYDNYNFYFTGLAGAYTFAILVDAS